MYGLGYDLTYFGAIREAFLACKIFLEDVPSLLLCWSVFGDLDPLPPTVNFPDVALPYSLKLGMLVDPGLIW